MDDESKGWRQFQGSKIDRKRLARHARRLEKASTRHAHRFVVSRVSNIKYVRREMTIWLTIVGAIIAGLGTQILWGQPNYLVSAARPGGSYVEATLGPIDTLNPLYASSSAEASAGHLMFSSLYDYDKTASLHQDVANGMEVTGGGKVYTVTLKDNVKWHDGKPLTAKDVVFTVNLMKNPATRSPLRVNWTDVSAKQVTNSKVEFTLPAVYAAFPYALTFPILPEHVLSGVNPAMLRENTFSQAPIGSGPFKFELLQQVDPIRNTKAIHMIANQNYYKGRAKLDRFELQAYPSEPAIISALRAGEVNGAVDVSAKASSNVSDAHYAKIPQPVDSGVYALFNTSNPILNDVKLRQALRAGLNRSAIREFIGHGTKPLDLPFIPDVLTNSKDLPQAPAYDQAEAKKMLDQAGWKADGSGVRSKDGKKLELTLTTTKSDEYQAVSDAIKNDWTALGVSVKVKVIDTTTDGSAFVQNTLQARNYDVLVYKLAIGADPDVYAYWHSSQLGQTGYNFSNYVSKSADAALASARSRIEPDLRDAKYKQFARTWLDDAPAIALYQPVSEYIFSKNDTTVETGSKVVTPADRYANVLDWSVHTDQVYKTP